MVFLKSPSIKTESQSWQNLHTNQWHALNIKKIATQGYRHIQISFVSFVEKEISYFAAEKNQEKTEHQGFYNYS